MLSLHASSMQLTNWSATSTSTKQHQQPNNRTHNPATDNNERVRRSVMAGAQPRWNRNSLEPTPTTSSSSSSLPLAPFWRMFIRPYERTNERAQRNTNESIVDNQLAAGMLQLATIPTHYHERAKWGKHCAISSFLQLLLLFYCIIISLTHAAVFPSTNSKCAGHKTMKATTTTITTTPSSVHSDSAMGLSISIRQVVQVQAKSALKQGALPTRHTSMRAWLGNENGKLRTHHPSWNRSSDQSSYPRSHLNPS